MIVWYSANEKHMLNSCQRGADKFFFIVSVTLDFEVLGGDLHLSGNRDRVVEGQRRHADRDAGVLTNLRPI